MIFTISDKPNKKNASAAVPFVGTKSYGILLQWIDKMQTDITEIVLANKSQVTSIGIGYFPDVKTPTLNTEIIPCDKVIAIGDKASKYLESLDIEHFKLPRPSQSKARTKKLLDKRLKECKNYLNRR